MTIPDIGHCAGSGAPPAEGSVRDENESLKTGLCPACSGRFELHPSGSCRFTTRPMAIIVKSGSNPLADRLSSPEHEHACGGAAKQPPAVVAVSVLGERCVDRASR